MSQTLVGKISVKSVVGKVENVKAEKAIMRVFGIATKATAKTTNFGTSVEFKGQFKAVNLESKKEFIAGKLFLPRLAENLLEGQFVGGDTPNEVKFGFIITVKPSDNTIGYEYGVEPLIKPTENDALALLESTLKK